ncbi:MAG: PH domain-containing protein [Synergistaceae bacterium]|nr:PH domain-containing protein [Synergistaceae bacterium]
MEQNDKAFVFRPSWKNYILQYLLVLLMLAIVFVVAFSNFRARWRDFIYIAGILSIISIAIRIVLDKYKNNTAWKSYIYQYLLTFAMVVIVAVVAFVDLNAGWRKLVSIVGAVYILSIAIEIVIDMFNERFTLKEDEVVMEDGILNRKSTEIDIVQIRTILVNQNLWQRLVSIGDLYIASAGTESYEIVAHGLSRPYELRDKIQSYIRSKPVAPADETTND